MYRGKEKLIVKHNVPIISLTGWYSPSFKWLMSTDLKTIREGLHKLDKNDLIKFFPIIIIDDAKKYSLYELRSSLLYIAVYKSRKVGYDYLKQYCATLIKSEHYIKGQFRLFLEFKKNNPGKGAYSAKKSKVYKAKYGKFWKIYFRKALKSMNSYDVESVAKRHNLTSKQALAKVYELKRQTGGSLSTYIKRYGKIEGTRRYTLFCQKSSHTKQKFKEKYGTSWKKKWRKYIKSKDSSSIEFHTNKYGKKVGLKKYKEKTLACTVNFEFYLRKYGDIVTADIEYRNFVLSKVKPWVVKGNGASITTEGRDFFRPIIKYLKKRNVKFIIGTKDKNEFYIWDSKKHRVRFYDFYIPSISHIIEFDGGTHPSPYLTEDELNSWRCFLSKKSAHTRLKQDKYKEDLAINTGHSFVRIHADEFNRNPEFFVKKHIHIIKNLLGEKYEAEIYKKNR